METQKIYVLAKIRKLPTFKEYGEYEVVFLYSDKEKNFKRIADCTPEIQKLAISNCPDLLNQYSDYRWNAKIYCLDCGSKEMVQVCEESLDFERFLEVKGNLALDSAYTDIEDEYSAWHLISNLVSEITRYGSEKDKGKVFVKCGNKAKIEVTFSVEFDEIDEILDEYFGD